jgi:16S rRNA (guanine527-N7)-methyltransferase
LDAFRQLKEIYEFHNERVNLVSRKDIQHIYLHHILHSLTLTKFVQWNSKCQILDLGTGGGFPAIPLAIFYKDVSFTAIDGTGKKIAAVRDIAAALKLTNVEALQLRAEDCKQKFHFIVSRAVTTLPNLCILGKPLIKKDSITALPNGVIAYKGGAIQEEIKDIRSMAYYENWNIYQQFPEEYFKEKHLVYLQLH